MRQFLFATLVGLGLALGSSRGDDDRFESDNKAQTVRPPVLTEGKKLDLPFRIKPEDLEGQTTVRAENVRQIEREIGNDLLVVGTVDSVYVPKGGTKLILNFGKDFCNCFKVVIDDSDYRKWGTKQPDAIGKMYEGKRVAVGGLVSEFQKKPQIVVTLPHQLTVIEDKKPADAKKKR